MMTAFYMFRLVSMTFFGAYRGPAWDHEASHGPVETDDTHDTHDAHDAAAGHGHGLWHGPHESPSPMTWPLMALAVGAIVAGLVGIPTALGGGNSIEHFLEPSFTAEQIRLKPDTTTATTATATTTGATSEATTAASEAGRSVRLQPDRGEATPNEQEAPTVSRAVELGLMGFSVLIAAIGIATALKFYITSPEISEQLAERLSGAHRLLSNKYYVDELYNSTVISGTMASGRGLWAVDRHVVDGAVNGASRLTVISSWFSGLTDRTVVDGLVNLVGWVVQEGSHLFRRLQTGLVQNYALLMLFGIFAFVSIYLFMR